MEHESKMICKFYADNILDDCKNYQGRPIGASCIGCKEKCIHAVDAGADIKAEDILMNKGKDNGNT